jgi:hypothetical protein
VADGDGQVEFVGEVLQFIFPEPEPDTVAAAAVGVDQQDF